MWHSMSAADQKSFPIRRVYSFIGICKLKFTYFQLITFNLNYKLINFDPRLIVEVPRPLSVPRTLLFVCVQDDSCSREG